MAKLPRRKPEEAEKLLLKAGFELIRTKGSHRIYLKYKTANHSIPSGQDFTPKDR